MRKILKLIRREYRASVKTKGFVIGLVLAPVLFCGGLLGTFLLKDRVDTTDKKVAIIDRSGKIAESLIRAAEDRNKAVVYDQNTGKKAKPLYILEVLDSDREKPEKQRLELSDRIRNGELYAFVEIGPEIAHPGKNPEASRITFYAKNAAVDEIREWIVFPINNQLRKIRMDDAGIKTDVKDLFAWINVDGLGLVSMDSETGAIKDAKRSREEETFLPPIIMTMLMFMMIMMGAVPLLNSVMEEKTQRIAEVLLGSISPFEFMMGKVIGGVAVSLTSSAVYVIGGVIAFRQMGMNQYIPYHILPWFFAYMVLAILMMGSLFASFGSACNDPKDAQSLSMPGMFLVVIPMFMFTPVIMRPESSLATWMSLFPTFTPTLMIMRLSTPVGVQPWQPWAGLVGMLLFTILFIWAGGRIFRIGILMQGKAPNIGNIIKWAIRRQ